ncbi:MAG: ribosome maturation factor RimP [Oligoflexia bacterium]
MITSLNGLVAPLGYEVVHLEIQSHREKILRLFIDWADNADSEKTIGIEDCAKVSRALDEPLDQVPELQALFRGAAYELEVSSPGIDRPLRRHQDYSRFSGRKVRIHTFRPLTADELGDEAYASQNPRQKNFMGELLGLELESIVLKSSIGNARVRIPLSLVAKANLDPEIDFDSSRAPKKVDKPATSKPATSRQGVKS